MNPLQLSAEHSKVDKKDYIVTPKGPGNSPLILNTGRSIAAIVPGDDIVSFDSARTGIEFWVVTATVPQARQIARILDVSMVGKGGGHVVIADSFSW